MCGIAGFCDFTRENRGEQWAQVGQRMGDTLRRRGPDEQGLWQSGSCVLAHRRLTVIDPEGGKQPMTCPCQEGTAALCYNGELYNTDALRRQLEGLGHRFQTRSDTEVLLRACLEYGQQVGERLEGIFAFAFWRPGQLLLYRDRFGVKPLFYAQVGSTLVFGSEPKALFQYPGLTPRADLESWQEVLGIGPARTPGHGVFAGVHEVKPGHCLRFTPRGGLQDIQWGRLISRPHRQDYRETEEQLAQLLTGAVRRQLVSDMPLCTLLSGGLDSSLITAIAAQEYQRRGLPALETYSFDYVDNDRYFTPSSFQPDADAPWVERMVECFGTRHRVLTCPTEHRAEVLPQAVEAKDLPGMGDVDSSLQWFCAQIRQRHVVALSGECSDEIFGGYPWFHRPDMLAADTFPWSMDMEARTQVLRPQVRKKLELEAYARERYRQSLAQTPRLEGEGPVQARRREMAWLNLNWFMTNLLDRKDRMSMSAGLEVRVPFCDHQLLEYVWNIPWEMKSRGGVRKQLLRDAAAGILPEDVRNRPKSPYPKTHNPAYERLARKALLAILDDREAPIHQLVDEAALRQGLLTDAGDYGRPWFGQLMAGPQMIAYLIELNCWMTRFDLSLEG